MFLGVPDNVGRTLGNKASGLDFVASIDQKTYLFTPLMITSFSCCSQVVQHITASNCWFLAQESI